MRKLMTMLIIFVVFTGHLLSAGSAYAELENWLDISDVNKGIVRVTYEVKPQIKTKLQVQRGQNSYTYNLISGQNRDGFPLQMGDGTYTITLLEQTSGKQYQVIRQETVKLQMADSNRVYLNSVQNVNWSNSKQATAKAKELTKGKKTDAEKVQAIYNYVISTVSYDKQLAVSLPGDGYLPDMDGTIASRKAICYGYSSLFAGMVRSVGIPAKLDMGTSAYVDTYHAWNEVYLNHKWVTIDTTVDAAWHRSKTAYTMIKDSSKYKVAKMY